MTEDTIKALGKAILAAQVPRPDPESYFDSLDPQQTLRNGSRFDAEYFSEWHKRQEIDRFNAALQKHLEKCLDIAISGELKKAGLSMPRLCETYVVLVWAESMYYITHFKLEICPIRDWEKWNSPYYKAFYLTYTDPGYICNWKGLNENKNPQMPGAGL